MRSMSRLTHSSTIWRHPSSYRDLQLKVGRNGSSVVLTAFPDGHDGHPATSLRVPLALLDCHFDAESRIVYYADVPGAFVDLAADLAFVLRSPSTAGLPADSGLPPIQLDIDPAPRTRGLSLSAADAYPLE